MGPGGRASGSANLCASRPHHQFPFSRPPSPVPGAFLASPSPYSPRRRPCRACPGVTHRLQWPRAWRGDPSLDDSILQQFGSLAVLPLHSRFYGLKCLLPCHSCAWRCWGCCGRPPLQTLATSLLLAQFISRVVPTASLLIVFVSHLIAISCESGRGGRPHAGSGTTGAPLQAASSV